MNKKAANKEKVSDSEPAEESDYQRRQNEKSGKVEEE